MQQILEVSQKAKRRMSGTSEEDEETPKLSYKSLMEWVEKDSTRS